MSEVRDWSAVDALNTDLDGYALSNPYQHVTRALMGAVRRKFDESSVSVKDFGAVGDGETDDTAAIEAALAAGAGKVVYIPHGTYLCSGELPIVGSGTTVVGDGPSSVVTLADYSQSVSGFVGVGVSNVTISNLCIKKFKFGVRLALSNDDADYPATETNCIKNITIKDCIFDTRRFAIIMYGVYGFLVSGVRLEQLRTTSWSNRDGIHLYGCSNGIITDVIGTTDDDFIGLSPSSGMGVTGVFRAVNFGMCRDIVVSKCVCLNTSGVPIESSATCSFIGIEGVGDTDLTDDVLTPSQYIVDRLTVRDCAVNLDTANFLSVRHAFGGVYDFGAPVVGSISITGCTVHDYDVPEESSGFALFTFNSNSISSLNISNCRFEIEPGNSHKHFLVSYGKIGSLTIDNSYITCDGLFLRFNEDVDKVLVSNVSFTEKKDADYNFIYVGKNINVLTLLGFTNNDNTYNRTNTLVYVAETAVVDKITVRDLTSARNLYCMFVDGVANNLFLSNVRVPNQYIVKRRKVDSDSPMMTVASDFSIPPASGTGGCRVYEELAGGTSSGLSHSNLSGLFVPLDYLSSAAGEIGAVVSSVDQTGDAVLAVRGVEDWTQV